MAPMDQSDDEDYLNFIWYCCDNKKNKRNLYSKFIIYQFQKDEKY